MPVQLPMTILNRLLAVLGLAERRTVADRRDAPYQVAALPVKLTDKGRLKVLLVTTRRHGRLIVPRGWPMDGKADAEAARIEAEEEAGVVGVVSSAPVGAYSYRSGRKASGALIRVDVYRLDVAGEAPRFKEQGERRLFWLDPHEAAARVGEPGLALIIRGLSGPG